MNFEINKRYKINNIIEHFKNNNYEIEIYRGFREKCRCGCCGKYYKNNNRVLNNIIKKYGNLQLKYYSNYHPLNRTYINDFRKSWDNEKCAQYMLEFGTNDEDYYNYETNRKGRKCITIYFIKEKK